MREIQKEHAKTDSPQNAGDSMKSKYSAQEKYDIVMESLTENVPQDEICRRHGIFSVQLSK